MKNVSAICRMELLLPIPTWNPSARCGLVGRKERGEALTRLCVFQEPFVALSNLNMLGDLCITSGDFSQCSERGFLFCSRLREPGQIASKATRLIRKLGSKKDLCPWLFNFALIPDFGRWK